MIANITILFTLQITFAFILGTSIGISFPHTTFKSFKFLSLIVFIIAANIAVSSALTRLLF